MRRSGYRGGSLRGVIAWAQNTVDRLRGLDPVRVDALVAALVLVWAAGRVADAQPDLRLADAVTDVAFAGAIVVRRRWLVQALLLLCVVLAGRYLLVDGRGFGQGGKGGVIAVLFLIYGCGAFLEGRRSWLGLGISLALVTGISLVKSSVLLVLFDDVAFALLPFLVGRARRLGRARELAERERAERLDSERELRDECFVVSGIRVRAVEPVADRGPRQPSGRALSSPWERRPLMLRRGRRRLGREEQLDELILGGNPGGLAVGIHGSVGEQRQRLWLPCLVGCRRCGNEADRKASR